MPIFDVNYDKNLDFELKDGGLVKISLNFSKDPSKSQGMVFLLSGLFGDN